MGDDRRGATAVEIVGITLALVAGVFLGLLLLQSDLSEGRAQTLAKNEYRRPADETSPREKPGKASQENDPTTADKEAKKASNELKAELQGLRREIALLREWTATAGDGSKIANPRSQSVDVSASRADSFRTRGQRTLDYWNAMNRVMEKEEAMRAVPSGGLTRSNVSDFLRRRGGAGRYASMALRSLETDLVDEDVVRLAEQIATWYEGGSRLNNRAEGLHRSRDEQARRGLAGQEWSSAEKGHRQSLSAINRTGDEQRRVMSRKYGLDFPDLR